MNMWVVKNPVKNIDKFWHRLSNGTRFYRF